MRFRHALTIVALAAAATLPFAGAAHARPDRDCPDFTSQAEAQEALDGAIGDPERLDQDGDGIACESHFREAAATTTPTTEPVPTSAPRAERSGEGQVRVLPRGGVDTGDGSTDPGLPASAPALAALAGMSLLAGAHRQRLSAG